MTFFVHKTTSRLARTLKIGTGKIFCARNPKITFKTSKNLLLLSYCTSLPKFECGTTKLQKSMWHYWKMKIFFFCVFYTVWTFSHPKMKSCSFSIRISKPKPVFQLNQKHQLLKFIRIFIFHVAIVNLMHRQKIRSYL